MYYKSPKNKMESNELIDFLGLNRVEEIIVYFGDENPLKDIKDFMRRTGFSHYGMRSSKPGGTFQYAVPRDKVLNQFMNYLYRSEDGVKICESMCLPDNFNLTLQGYIYIDRSFNVICEANNEPGMSLRHSMGLPKYKWYFSDLEERAPRILVDSGILDLITRHELFDVVVEFTYYDIPVGRNKEPLLIWEIRNY